MASSLKNHPTQKEDSSSQRVKSKRQWEELKIPVSWGYVSAKWWGPHSVRPIVAIHGWQENSGSFDTLIPKLPSHISFLAIDLPGHGFSPRVPSGMKSRSTDTNHLLNMIINHFKWDRISLLGHSLGAIYSFVFAGMFPQKVDMVIALDALKPPVSDTDSTFTYAWSRLNVITKADGRARELNEEASYSYDELVEKWCFGTFGSISSNSCRYLLARNVKKCSKYPGCYNIINKHLEKGFGKVSCSQDFNMELTYNIKMPFCFIKASKEPSSEDKERFEEVLRFMAHNDKFEFYIVRGTHHVHLNEPHKVSHIIGDFIKRHRPELENYV